MKEFVIFDVDGTLVRGQSQKLFIDYLLKKRVISYFLYFKIYIWFALYRIGLVNNPKKIMESAYSFLVGRKYNWTEKMVDDFFNKILKKEFFKKSVEILNNHKKKGREVVLVSNLPDILLSSFARYLEVQKYFGTRLEVIDGKFTGRILGDIMYGANKAYIVNRNILNGHSSTYKIWIYADHLSDLPLLEIATFPFIVNPEKKLEKIAAKRNWGVLRFL